MSENQFYLLCLSKAIDPAIALENMSIVNALKQNKSVDVIELLLDSEF